MKKRRARFAAILPLLLAAGRPAAAASARVSVDVHAIDFGTLDPGRPAGAPSRVQLLVVSDGPWQLSIAVAPLTSAAGSAEALRLSYRQPGDRFRDLTARIPAPVATGQSTEGKSVPIVLDLVAAAPWELHPGATRSSLVDRQRSARFGSRRSELRDSAAGRPRLFRPAARLPGDQPNRARVLRVHAPARGRDQQRAVASDGSARGPASAARRPDGARPRRLPRRVPARSACPARAGRGGRDRPRRRDGLDGSHAAGRRVAGSGRRRAGGPLPVTPSLLGRGGRRQVRLPHTT